MTSTLLDRDRFTLTADDGQHIALQRQRPQGRALADVVYVHGATFGADLSVYYAFDGRSWADELAEVGMAVWGFDFVGYGASSRYPANGDKPAGDIDAALQDLRRVVRAIRERNGDRPLVLLAHSRGGAVAARYAAEFADDVLALVLFAPIVVRAAAAAASVAAAGPVASHQLVRGWAQYRRFIEDVPRGEPQVLSEAHMHEWAQAYLASDAASGTRRPPSVMVPAGPWADVRALWSGQALYEPARIVAPTLLVRGQWDASCDDDAAQLMSRLAARIRRDVKIDRATHLMHLEQRRRELHAQVNRFLLDLPR
ncbi:MAG TPA: alpha/beta fold hydrolase [Burkholderiaceae bacterium]|nr:alpha/beta fold hydrolase [Burkholderiaceae bacterium]